MDTQNTIQAGQAFDKFNVKDLNLYYGNFHALKGISMDIKEKEITAFIGPSGCGKSTFLKTLNRMNDLIPDCKITGEVLIDGVDLYGKVDINVLRKRVGMVFQKPNPFPMSVYDNIAYGPQHARHPQKGAAGRDRRALLARRPPSGTSSKTG